MSWNAWSLIGAYCAQPPQKIVKLYIEMIFAGKLATKLVVFKRMIEIKEMTTQENCLTNLA